MPAVIHCHIKGQYFIAFTTFTFLPLPLLPYTEAYMLKRFPTCNHDIWMCVKSPLLKNNQKLKGFLKSKGLKVTWGFVNI